MNQEIIMKQAHATEHLMRLDRTYPSGAEEWHCIYCQRRILKQREPVAQEIILNVGLSPEQEGHQIIDTEISEDLWLALEKVFEGMELDW